MFELTNFIRIANGLQPLHYNEKLSAAAQDHARRMADEGFFEHDSPGGTTPGDRMRDANYDWLVWGENIAAGYLDSHGVMQAWLDSPGHRANLLNSSFIEIGLGYVSRAGNSSLEYPFWVQDFAAPQIPLRRP